MTVGQTNERNFSARKKFRILFSITLVLSLAAAVLQTFFFLTRYDESLMLYQRGQTPTVFYLVCAAIALLLLLSFLLFRRENVPQTLAQPGRLINFASLFCGFFLACSILLYAIYFLSGITPELSTLCVATIAAAIPAALYFLVTALNAQPNRKLLILSGFFILIWGVLFLLGTYFDMSVPMTSPSRPLGYLSVLSIMFYFLLEIRFILGNAKPRLYLSVSLMAIFTLSLTSIPNFILIAMGTRSSDNSIFHIAETCILFYILARMLSVFTGRAFTSPAEYAAESKPKDTDSGTQEKAVGEQQ